MSKADQLGAGRFGGGVRPVSARRQAVAAATGVPTEGVAPPTELPPHRVSLNPDNPRSSLGDLTDLTGSLATHGQKQAITVMNRDAYIKANPEREADLEPDTTHVVIDGSSRLAAAREARLAVVKVMVSDDQGANSEELLESALVANIHRHDLGELDEARALRRLLAIHGSQTALSKRLHRSQGWVSQRLALLNLTPELQGRIGEEPIDLLRAVANKPVENQETALRELKEERARREEEKRSRKQPPESSESPDSSDRPDRPVSSEKPARREPEGEVPAPDVPPVAAGEQPDEPEGRHESGGDTEPDVPAPHVAQAPAQAPAPAADEADAQQPVPEPRAEAPVSRPRADSQSGARVRTVPYNEPGTLAMLLDRNIEDDDTFFDLLRFLSKKGRERDPARLAELARSFAEDAERAAVPGE
ncbi:ParB/RepB/Spo0J family partition protein [Streptomyces monashensis]|uniref:Plasmid partitioning protein n=1 Tax=Streptomyces monashensis TaxID=1678012 RepID=A0A1S2QIW1_9ACTN|nr:ParB/RepB/Spo0J family partition protein [Streptomyces monashensis]OIK06024.1 plasmid partitioning protein [Streptomyces monashensis]